MKLTSAQANKLLKSNNEKLSYLYQQAAKTSTYIEVAGVDPIVPEFSIATFYADVIELQDTIAKLKHTINVFNSTTVIPEFELTIDHMLVKMAMLNKLKLQLGAMRETQSKEINSGYGARQNVVEYKVANYSPKEADSLYNMISDEITKMQLALDTANNTILFDFDD